MALSPGESDFAYDAVKRRQTVVWVFLFGIVFICIAAVSYVVYQVVIGGASSSDISNNAVATPPAVTASSAARATPADERYFLYGEFSATDQKYKIFKIYWAQAAREELFSFLWKDSVAPPRVLAATDHIGIFPARDRGFFIRHDGSRESVSVFVPPDEHFSVSPDGALMFYFKYLSSIGNSALALRDMKKGEDVYAWSPRAAASAVCDFAGWSSDGATAYCVARAGGNVTVRALSAVQRAAAVVASVSGAEDAKYYPEQGIFLFTNKDAVNIIRTGANTADEIARAPSGFAVANALLAADGSRIAYTVVAPNGAQRTYTVSPDGSDNQELVAGRNARVIALSPDADAVLFAEPDTERAALQHYFIANIKQPSPRELYVVDASAQEPQFLGWFGAASLR